MNIGPLPFNSSLGQYEKQANSLFEACKSVDSQIIGWIKERPHLVKELSSEPGSDSFTLEDAQLIVARWYQFESWQKLAEFSEAAATENSPAWQFESAVEAIITG